jgi:hypothetical protein
VSYRNADQLVRYVDSAIIDRANAAAAQIAETRQNAVGKPVSVARFGLPKRPNQRR